MVDGTFASTGLAVMLWKPRIVWDGSAITTYEPHGAFVRRIATGGLEGYSHTIQRVGGFDKASFGLTESVQTDAEWWLSDSVGLHVEVLDRSNTIVWEGFIDEVSTTIGSLTIRRGPVTAIGNDVVVTYEQTEQGYSSVPVSRNRVTTAPTYHDESIRLYGLRRKELATGSVASTAAIALGLGWVQSNALPRYTQAYTFERGGAKTFPITVSCLGYSQMLNYAYENIPVGATGIQAQTITAKIGAILDADPNGLFSSANADIATNALAVDMEESAGRDAWSLLKALNSYGMATGNSTSLGVYEGRKVVYSEMTATSDEYIEEAMGELLGPPSVALNGTTPIPHWLVRPGKFMRYSDIFVGYQPIETLGQDPRRMLIEAVTFTWPDDLSISSGRLDTPMEALNSRGLGGAN